MNASRLVALFVSTTSLACSHDWDRYRSPTMTASCDGADEIDDPATKHCYRLSSPPSSWSDARDDCSTLGPDVDLAAPSTLAEIQVVLRLVSTEVWIGGTDAPTEGTFTWSNGEPWSYPAGAPPWAAGEPSNTTAAEDCVVLQVDGAIGARTCDLTLASICERSSIDR